MTDGNLATHARRLKSAGLVEIDKTFRDGKPVTTFILTAEGRAALHAHVQQLMGVLHPQDAVIPAGAATPVLAPNQEDDNWID
jgi:DNA-binding PadR family transcriptional regulator